jgi:hypothetical protein
MIVCVTSYNTISEIYKFQKPFFLRKNQIINIINTIKIITAPTIIKINARVLNPSFSKLYTQKKKKRRE